MTGASLRLGPGNNNSSTRKTNWLQKEESLLINPFCPLIKYVYLLCIYKVFITSLPACPIIAISQSAFHLHSGSLLGDVAPVGLWECISSLFSIPTEIRNTVLTTSANLEEIYLDTTLWSNRKYASRSSGCKDTWIIHGWLILKGEVRADRAKKNRMLSTWTIPSDPGFETRRPSSTDRYSPVLAEALPKARVKPEALSNAIRNQGTLAQLFNPQARHYSVGSRPCKFLLRIHVVN